MGFLENPRIPLFVLVGVISLVGIAFYLNARYQFAPLLLPEANHPEVIVDLPSITTQPTVIPKVTLKPTTSLQPTSNTTPQETVPTSMPELTPEPEVTQTQQTVQLAVNLNPSRDSFAALCNQNQVDQAKPIVEDATGYYSKTYQPCVDSANKTVEACINDNCSGYNDIFCVESCGEQNQPLFDTCENNYTNAKQEAKSKLAAICSIF